LNRRVTPWVVGNTLLADPEGYEKSE